MKTIKCKKCGNEMAVYGITEKGYFKFHCADCYFTTVECENEESGEDEEVKCQMKMQQQTGPN